MTHAASQFVGRRMSRCRNRVVLILVNPCTTRLSWSLLVATALSVVAACTLNSAGLVSADPGRMAVVAPNAGAAGDTGAGGAVGMADAGEDTPGSAGALGGSGGAGAVPGSGAAGDGLAGGGDGGPAGSGGTGGAAGGGEAGSDAPPDASGAAGASAAPPDAQPISPLGCADGTREGFKSLDKYANIAACAGAWQVPGFVAAETLTPQCDRRAGNDGTAPTGLGCSVADLCAEGWHVCESALEVSMNAGSCVDAALSGAPPAFYATRQHGSMMTCDRMNQTGTSNIFGCGDLGSVAVSACAPLKRMLRDVDCRANPPWMCLEGPIGQSANELANVTKPGAARGGVLCCR
jgi:hypothetical protein